MICYEKNNKYINNDQIKPDYYSVAAFNPVGLTTLKFYIFDMDDNKMEDIIHNYKTVIQNLRLIKRPAKNVWSQQDKIWSESALGQDNKGNVLFIFSRSPYSMYDFNNILIKLPIQIICAQHLEGGPAASLYFSYKDDKIEKVGSYETTYYESNNNHQYPSIPNVIGFFKNKSFQH